MIVRRGNYVGSHDAETDCVSKHFGRLRREASLDGHRRHDLRHFMATEMIHAGVPILIVAARSPTLGRRPR